MSQSQRTALNGLHTRLGARMVDFAGWDMPIQYPGGIIAEHHAVRTACGLFDLSHMGRVFVRGSEALDLAQVCCTRDLARIRPGEAAYSLLCRQDGGIIDDIIGYVLERDEVLLVFNASNREIDIAWFTMQRETRSLDAVIHDGTFETALIGVQGPRAQEVLQAHTTVDLDTLPGYAFIDDMLAGAEALISRTGYTGEDGFEVMVDADRAEHVWSVLQDSAQPCGLGARDTLRTEAGFALYGHEIDAETNPYEARLGWVVNLGKADFIGRDALARIKEEGPSRRLVGLTVQAGGVPRPDFPILQDGSAVGRVTSGTFSPTLKCNIAMGYVPTSASEVGSALAVETRGKPVGAEVTPLPFVPHHSRPRSKM